MPAEVNVNVISAVKTDCWINSAALWRCAATRNSEVNNNMNVQCLEVIVADLHSTQREMMALFQMGKVT